MITCSLMPRRARATAIAPALGVVPPSSKLSHSSTRSAPPRSAAIADSTESTQTSMISFGVCIDPHSSSLSERTYQPLTETLRRPAYQYLCASDGCRSVASTCLRNGFVTAQSQRGVVLSGCYLLSDWQRHI